MPEVSLIKVIFLNIYRLVQSLPASSFPPKHGGHWARWPRTVGWSWFISLANGTRYDGRGELSQKQQQKKIRKGEKKEGEGRGEKKKEKKKKTSKAKQNYHSLAFQDAGKSIRICANSGRGRVDFKDSLSSQYLELGDESKQVGQD